MNDRILSLLGLCRRAGKLTPGNDAVIDDVTKGISKLVIVTSNISKNTEKKILLNCHRCNVKVLKINRTTDELSCAIGKFSAVVSVQDSGFAKKLSVLIENEKQEENAYD